jgi:hypothetical protein
MIEYTRSSERYATARARAWGPHVILSPTRRPELFLVVPSEAKDLLERMTEFPIDFRNRTLYAEKQSRTSDQTWRLAKRLAQRKRLTTGHLA